MRRKINEDSLIHAGVSFLLPVLVLMFTISRASVNIMNGVDIQMNDVEKMRGLLSSGRLFLPYVISDVLTRRLYPSFIISLLIGGTPGKFILRCFYYIRFGLMSAGMYYWSEKHVRIPRLQAVLIGFIYSLCSISLNASLVPHISNIMIVMPVALCAADTLLRRGSHKDVCLAAGVFALFATGGFEGIITGLLFVAASVWILSGLITDAKLMPALKAMGLYLIFEIPVLLLVFVSEKMFVDFKSEVWHSRVTFTVFDMLCSGLDGTPVNLPADSSYAVFGVTIFVAFNAILFFINSNIPYKAKLAGVITIVLVVVSMSWSLFDAVLSVYENMSEGLLMRTGMLCVLLFLLATISWRNAGNVPRNGIYGAAAIIFAFIVIANSSSASEVTRSVFTIWFSAGAVVFWSIVLLINSEDRVKAVNWCAVLGIVGMIVNVYYCFTVSEFSGAIPDNSVYGESETTLHVMVNDDFPLYGTRNEYILVPSDLRSYTTNTFPERINVITNNLMQEDLFERAESFTVFSSGVIDHNAFYYTCYRGEPFEILDRCENMIRTDEYYVYSSFGGHSVLTESYDGEDIVSNIEGPAVKVLDRKTDAVSLRLVGVSASDTEIFSLWHANPYVMNEIRSRLRPMEGFEASIEGDQDSPYYYAVTIVTSVPYSKDFDIQVYGPEGRINTRTFGYAGRLAATFSYNGRSDYSFRITSSGLIPYLSVAQIGLLFIVFICLMIKYSKAEMVETHAQQED